MARLLLIEDDPKQREMYGSALREAGHELIEATSCADALERFTQTRVDLVVSDLGLPDGNGEELAQQLRAMRPKLPILAISGGFSIARLFRRPPGFVDFLGKPFAMTRLVELVERHLPEARRPELVGDGLRVLAVDDELENLELVREALERSGYQVDTLAEPLNALAHALQHPPDLVVLDQDMPGLDGFEVCRRLREASALAETPIILVCPTFDEHADPAHAHQVGATGLVLRSPSYDNLVALLTEQGGVTVGDGVPTMLGPEFSVRLLRSMERKATQLQAVEREARRMRAELAALAGFADVVATGAGVEDMLRRMVDSGSVQAAAVFEPRRSGRLELKCTVGFSEEVAEFWGQRELLERAFIPENLVLTLSDVESSAGAALFGSGQARLSLVPLVCSQVPVGVLVLGHEEEVAASFLHAAQGQLAALF